MENIGHSEPIHDSGNFFRLNPKLLQTGMVKVPVYRGYDNGTFVLLTNKPENYKKMFEEKKLGSLYISKQDQKIFYEEAATAYLDNLRDKLNTPSKNNKEIARLVVDWMDISLDEMMKVDPTMTAKHLQTFINDFLTGFKDGKLEDLFHEVQKFDYSTAQHSIETMLYTLNYFNTLPEQTRRLNEIGSIAALLHDIGKQKIAPSIILKPDQLTDMEYTEIKKHPEYGLEILKHINFVSLGFNEAETNVIINAATQHHEREDGTGYPKGLAHDQISDYGKILSIIDVYAALTSKTRTYRDPLPPDMVIQILKKDEQAGKLYGPFLDHFIFSLSKLGIKTNQETHS